jgi:hypothetical protein
VTDKKKWKDMVRQAKAHSGLQCQWKKKKNVARLTYQKLVYKIVVIDDIYFSA